MSTDHKSNQRILRAGERAAHYFTEGYCCSEAIMLAMSDVYPNGAKAEIAGVASGLCGGMGNKKATCGVFTGGAAALGLVAGKAPQKGGNKQIRELASRYHETLEQEAGGQICEEILKQMGIRNLNKRLCRKLTRRGSELLAQLIEQSELSTRTNSDK
ncbi:C-GCAxxG-C-C family protein [endosymbiont of Ridgeia piscesae]|nr:C-GCAxxG-C-C family protein [endosymbiont of Ridgeia piscesae]